MCSVIQGGRVGTGMCSELEDYTKPLVHQVLSSQISSQHGVVERLKSKGLKVVTER